MMANPDNQSLRAIAEHRGLKLLKSRKRKPGSGDYGKFGLTDIEGKPLLGIGKTGLTASLEEIEAYLRDGAASTWKASAIAIPARAAAPPGKTRPVKAAEQVAVIRPRPKRAADTRSVSSIRTQKNEYAPKKLAAEGGAGQKKRENKPPPRHREKAVAKAARSRALSQEPASELVIRAVKPSDAAALAPFLCQLAEVTIDELGLAHNLAAARKARGGVIVATMQHIVGCCGWAIIPTIQHGLIGRLTVLLVQEEYRRRGIARTMMDEVNRALSKAGCRRIEALSNIEIRNAHNFFRTLGFAQTSYRFARAIPPSDS